MFSTFQVLVSTSGSRQFALAVAVRLFENTVGAGVEMVVLSLMAHIKYSSSFDNSLEPPFFFFFF